MLIFDYGGRDPSMDRGGWEMSITAPNRGVADQHFATHIKLMGWDFKPEDHFRRSRMLGRNGILYSDLEQRHGGDEDDGGLRRRPDGPAEAEGV
jgi:hypothetical protein